MKNHKSCQNCEHWGKHGKCTAKIIYPDSILNHDQQLSRKSMMANEGMYCNTYKGDKPEWGSLDKK